MKDLNGGQKLHIFLEMHFHLSKDGENDPTANKYAWMAGMLSAMTEKQIIDVLKGKDPFRHMSRTKIQ